MKLEQLEKLVDALIEVKPEEINWVGYPIGEDEGGKDVREGSIYDLSLGPFAVELKDRSYETAQGNIGRDIRLKVSKGPLTVVELVQEADGPRYQEFAAMMKLSDGLKAKMEQYHSETSQEAILYSSLLELIE